MKDDSIVYFIANIIAYIIIFILCLVAILNIFDSMIIRIVLICISFFVCGYIEERILSRYINELVEALMKLM